MLGYKFLFESDASTVIPHQDTLQLAVDVVGRPLIEPTVNLYAVCVPGHVHSRVVYYLMNIRVLPRTIYITRVSKHTAASLHNAALYQYVNLTR